MVDISFSLENLRVIPLTILLNFLVMILRNSYNDGSVAILAFNVFNLNFTLTVYMPKLQQFTSHFLSHHIFYHNFKLIKNYLITMVVFPNVASILKATWCLIYTTICCIFTSYYCTTINCHVCIESTGGLNLASFRCICTPPSNACTYTIYDSSFVGYFFRMPDALLDSHDTWYDQLILCIPMTTHLIYHDFIIRKMQKQY